MSDAKGPEPARCKTCPAHFATDDDGRGQCRLGPPTLVVPSRDGAAGAGQWRWTGPDDWCMAHPENAGRMAAPPLAPPSGPSPGAKPQAVAHAPKGGRK